MINTLCDTALSSKRIEVIVPGLVDHAQRRSESYDGRVETLKNEQRGVKNRLKGLWQQISVSEITLDATLQKFIKELQAKNEDYSRAYRLREDRLERLTQDHTLNRAGLSHVLHRALGLEDGVRLDHAVHLLRLHDRFMLCSDGVHGMLGDKRLREILAQRTAPEQTARQLVSAALGQSGTDNASALVIDIIGLAPLNRSDLEMTLGALPIKELPAIGETVDGFALEEIISDGRYSRLIRARDTIGEREVALKFPHPRVASEASYRMAFVREAWIVAHVRSPWIGQVLELPPGRQSRLYSVMPFYDGETLERRLKRPPALSLHEGIDIATKLARAIAALHRAGVIHRDIKPDNIILKRDGGLKLVDLGVARVPRMEEFPPEDIPGTPSYMAPELFDGKGGDELSDLFALGVTLFRSFTGGAYPYGEVEPFSHPRFTKPAPLSRYRPDLPSWLDGTLAKAFAPEPTERFGDVLELAFDNHVHLFDKPEYYFFSG